VSLPASGVRYTDGQYTCPTADIRALRAAGYDSSSSRQTIRYQRCGQCSAENTDSRETDFSQTHGTSTSRALSASPPPSSELLSFCESSYNLRSQLFHAPAA
jgi:hypothetical protein